MKRCTVVVLACLMTVGTLCGCMPKTDTRKDEALPQILIGSDTYPPYIYMDNNGDITGLDVEIAREAFHRMGYEASFIAIDWEQKESLVDSGEIDCIWGCFSMAGREENYQWAGPYMISRQVVAVNEKSDIHTMRDLAGKTIAVQSTSKPEEIFLNRPSANIPEVKEVFSLEDRSVQYAALDSGYVDATATHEMAILQYMKDYGADFRILDEPLLITGIGVAFSNNDHRGLADELTETFTQMRQDGTMLRLVGAYLEHPEIYLEVDALG